MPRMYQYEMTRISKRMVEEMIKVKQGEVVAITADSGTDEHMIDTLASAVFAAGGKPLTMWMPSPRRAYQEAVVDLPAKALTEALCKVDVWVELTQKSIIYSEVFEEAFRRNKKMRYVIAGGTTIPQLESMIMGYDIQKLGKLLGEIKEMLKSVRQVRVTNDAGTDVRFEMDQNFVIEFDDGDFSKPKFGTMPGHVNVIPKFGSVNGNIVFDAMTELGIIGDEKVEFIIEDGKITEISGGPKARKMRDFLESYEDKNIYKVAHMMIGLHPGLRKLTGSLVADERIWGGATFGFGHVSPMSAPPHGQPAKGHLDGIVCDIMMYFDNVKIIEKGTFIHPKLMDYVWDLI